MAVHVLAVLAYQNGGGVSSKLLAASVNTNPVIIRRLLLALQQAKLVETRKGARFGSRLKRSAALIRLIDVYRAVELNDPFVLPRHKPNVTCPVGRGIAAALEQVFASARLALEQDLAKTTLAHLLERLKAGAARPLMIGKSALRGESRRLIIWDDLDENAK